MPHIIRLIVAFAAVAGCASTERNKQTVRSVYEQCINRGRLELLPELIAADYVGPQGDAGPTGYRNTIEDLRRGFPDIQFRIEQLIAEGDRVVVRWSWNGRHNGTFRSFAPSHALISNSGIAIYQLRDGKLVRGWLEWSTRASAVARRLPLGRALALRLGPASELAPVLRATRTARWRTLPQGLRVSI
jgi:predicted ester cyclase